MSTCMYKKEKKNPNSYFSLFIETFFILIFWVGLFNFLKTSFKLTDNSYAIAKLHIIGCRCLKKEENA